MNPDQLPARPMNVPPEPGDGHHPPWNIRRDVLASQVLYLQVPPNVPVTTFWEAVHLSWRNLWGGQQAPDEQVDRNVHPQVTPVRRFWFIVGSVSFLCALHAFSATQYYTLTIGARGRVARVAFFCTAVIIHTIALVSLLFFGFCDAACERYRHYFLIKSVGDFLVMFGSCLLLLKIRHNSQIIIPAMAPYDHDRCIRFSEVAGVVTSALITLDALSIINLLRPGHHYFMFEVTTTLTMHFALELLINRRPYNYIGAFAALLIFVIIVVKNFIWRNVVHGHPSSVNHDDQRHLALVRDFRLDAP
jgi:hypothetical protein